MLTHQQLIPCPTCTFLNDPSCSVCQICNSPLIDDTDSEKTDLVNKQTTVKVKTPKKIRSKVLLLFILTISIASISKVFPTHIVTHSLFSRNVLNERGDIKLYNTMEEVPNVPNGIADYGGAICFAALKRDGMNTAIENAHPKFKLRYIEPINGNPGCTTGIQMLLDRNLTIAQNSRPLTEAELDVAELRGFKLESVPIAIDGVVFYVNKSLGIKSLSIEEIQDIYRGKITNWQELGGNDLPIVPISLDPQIDSILRLLMKTKDAPMIDDRVVITRDYTSAIRQTSTTPGAISYASAAILRGQQSIKPIALALDKNSPAIPGLLADGSVNHVGFEKNFYPLTRPLSIVFRRDNTPSEQAAVAYINLILSKEGQKIVKSAGMIPIHYDR
ncbi:MAG: substrate-binding domain-containing protein [Cyanobacteria bacterium J06600_6]